MTTFRLTRVVMGTPFEIGVEYDKLTLTTMAIEELASISHFNARLATAKIALITERAVAQQDSYGVGNDRSFKTAVDLKKAPFEVAVESTEESVELHKTRLRMITMALECLE